jgi:hypothetical protein
MSASIRGGTHGANLVCRRKASAGAAPRIIIKAGRSTNSMGLTLADISRAASSPRKKLRDSLPVDKTILSELKL